MRGFGDHRTFRELRARGIRGTSGPLTVVHLPAGTDEVPGPPRVAFAIGRRVGKAVVRNRVRRRLRHLLVELERSPTPGLPRGSYLVVARPGADGCTSDELRSHLVRALRRIDKKSQG